MIFPLIQNGGLSNFLTLLNNLWNVFIIMVISVLYLQRLVFLKTTKSIAFSPYISEMVPCTLSNSSHSAEAVAVLDRNPKFAEREGLCVFSGIDTLKPDKQVSLTVWNVFPPEKIAGPKSTCFARFTFFASTDAIASIDESTSAF